MGKFNEISQNLKQSFDGNDIDINILQDKVVIDSNKKVIEINNTLRATNVEINGVPSECFTSAEKEKLNKISTPMQVVGRLDSVELLPTDVAIGSVYLVGQEGSSDFEEYIAISSDPTTYESLGKTQTPQVQVDWNQTTSTESDYIKNKPAIKAGQGAKSIIEGNGTSASGLFSHAEGSGTSASGNYSHAEGDGTSATMDGSHAEGFHSTASGSYSHAEGNGTKASGSYSHTEGNETTASGYFSHAEGFFSIAKNKSQHVFGEYNIADPSLNNTSARGNYVEIVGNGTTSSARSNARTLDWQGNETLAGALTCGGNIIASGTNINEALGSTQGFSGVKFRVISGSLQVCIDGFGSIWKTITLV